MDDPLLALVVPQPTSASFSTSRMLTSYLDSSRATAVPIIRRRRWPHPPSVFAFPSWLTSATSIFGITKEPDSRVHNTAAVGLSLFSVPTVIYYILYLNYSMHLPVVQASSLLFSAVCSWHQWQAAKWPSLYPRTQVPFPCRCPSHGQRVWNRQPEGGLIGLGTSPFRIIRSRFTVGSAMGIAEARPGCTDASGCCTAAPCPRAPQSCPGTSRLPGRKYA